MTDGADGIVVGPSAIILVAPEVISAFDRQSGNLLWSRSMTDTGPNTPVLIDGDLVVVAPADEVVQAFDLATGAPRPVPSDVSAPPPQPPSPKLPDGYSFENGELSFGERVIWSGGGAEEPFARRLGNLTVINDDEYGLVVVDDLGTVLKDLPITGRNVDATPPIIDGSEIIAVTSEGALIRLTVGS